MRQKQKTVSIKGMHCKSCEILTEEELSVVPSVRKADVNHRTGRATVFYDGAEPDDEMLHAAVRRAGYEIGENDRSWFSRDLSSYLEIATAVVGVGVLSIIGMNQGWFSVSLGSTENLDRLPAVLLAGVVAGLSTCMAIVGGMVLAVSARFGELHPEASARRKFVPHVFFNLGRVLGFAFFGGALGFLGSTIQPSAFVVGWLTVFVAVIMVLLGLQLLEFSPRISSWKVTLPKGVAKMFGMRRRTEEAYGHGRTMLLGAFTFFLPCGFTQAVQLFVVTRGDMLLGALVMGTFALGTAPGLLGIGGMASVAKGAMGRYFFKIAGVAVIALGVLSFGNGMSLVQLGPSATQPKTNGEKQQAPETKKEPVVIRMTQEADGYFPNEFSVKKDRPVRWIIDSKESYSCAVSLVAPKIGVRKVLRSGENVIEFTPKTAGDIPFSCSMGMYRGVIHVVE